MATFLVVGKSFSGLKRKILERGDDYILLQDRLATKYPDKIFKKRLVVNFEQKDKLLASVKSFKDKVDGVITVYENYILPTAWIANHLGLPGLSVEAAEACTDKFIMRQRFAKALESISPDFQIVKTEEDLSQFAKTHSFPLILKPANLQKSLLVTKSRSFDELLTNYQKTMEQINAIYKRYAPHRQPQLLIEEFMEGPIYSVDAFVDDTGKPQVLQQVVDYQTGYDIGYDDNFHYSRRLPSALSQTEIEDIRLVAAQGCEALGMTSSPAHVEIIRTKDTPKIVEIGARNGGYRERMHSLANDLDILGMALDTALGKSVNIKAQKNESVAVMELFPKKAGIFQGINNEDKLRQLESLEYFALKQPVGKHVGKSADGYKMCAIVILHNHDKDQFNQDLNFVNKRVFVETK